MKVRYLTPEIGKKGKKFRQKATPRHSWKQNVSFKHLTPKKNPFRKTYAPQNAGSIDMNTPVRKCHGMSGLPSCLHNCPISLPLHPHLPIPSKAFAVVPAVHLTNPNWLICSVSSSSHTSRSFLICLRFLSTFPSLLTLFGWAAVELSFSCSLPLSLSLSLSHYFCISLTHSYISLLHAIL